MNYNYTQSDPNTFSSAYILCTYRRLHAGTRYRRSRTEAEVLYTTGLLDTRDDERFERLTRLARKAFQVPVALISLLDRERQWLLACQGVGVRETPRDISFCGHAILQEGPLYSAMRLPMRDFTIIQLLPVSHASGSTPASR